MAWYLDLSGFFPKHRSPNAPSCNSYWLIIERSPSWKTTPGKWACRERTFTLCPVLSTCLRVAGRVTSPGCSTTNAKSRFRSRLILFGMFLPDVEKKVVLWQKSRGGGIEASSESTSKEYASFDQPQPCPNWVRFWSLAVGHFNGSSRITLTFFSWAPPLLPDSINGKNPPAALQ